MRTIPALPMLPDGRAIEVLACGEVEVLGRLPWSSNATLLATCTLAGDATHAVYKPGQGERPLWDFPPALYKREAAAWVVSESLGWGLVPETLVREDAPLGPGSLQRFVPADFEQHYFTLLEEDRHHERLRQMAAFDVVCNNTDRKSGHVLLDNDGNIYGIDNALCFHHVPKIRTVIWDFAGDPLPREWRADMARFAADPPSTLCRLLSKEEIDAACQRAAKLAKRGYLPDPDPYDHPYPWPLV